MRCKSIIVNDNSKGGLCCSASIDLVIGCSNKCISCYGLKVSMLSNDKMHTDNPIKKEYDDKFIKSIKKYKNKGIKYIRLGKFSDGAHADRGTLLKVIKTCTEEQIKLVFVTKSLIYDKEIAKALVDGEHILHVSLGMIGDAQSDNDRIKMYNQYKKAKVNVKLRIVSDITKQIPVKYSKFKSDDVILTPLRFNKLDDLLVYQADINSYSFIKGYYRPKFHDSSWLIFENICGEINNTLFCCKCMV